MLRYYMTAETRESVIAESNRMIAARAASNAARRPRGQGDAVAPTPAHDVHRAAAEGGEERRVWVS